jgi:alpha-glucosidase
MPKSALSLFAALAAIALTSAIANGQTSRSWAGWQHAVIYEVYPRTFGDTNGDGIGDLNGITEHLDYLADLGIDAIWITPFYPSPQVDFGYDISDYQTIDPRYGTMADFDRLVTEAKKRNIRIVIDLVLNHTSDQHTWFLESRSSRNNPKAAWYVWHDAKPDGKPPNNWQSVFGRSAWQWSAMRGQYYYHMFYREQPDLNWNNRDVRNAMYDVMRFWLKRGVAGFRLDAVDMLFEDRLFRDERVTGGVDAFGGPMVAHEYTANLPEIHDVLRELRRVTDEFPDRALIGETYVPDVRELAKMYGAKNDELQLPMDTQFGFLNRLSADGFRSKLREAANQLNGNNPLFVFDNHDNPRSWNRYGDGVHDAAIARLLAILLLTPRCASLLYYGEEIGMANNDPKRREDVRDPIGISGWPKEKGRDGERTPMQWNGGRQAGFSNASRTWLPVAPNYKERNVAAERRDPDSLFNFYKTLIRLRKTNAALRDGGFVLVNETDHDVLSYLRKSSAGTAVLVALNLSAETRKVSFNLRAQGVPGRHAVTLLSSYAKPGQSADLEGIVLPAYGGWVGQIQ